MARFTVYVSEVQHRQVLERWPDFNFSQALRLKLAELLAGDGQIPITLCENCGRRARWFGPPKKVRRTVS